MSGFGVVLLASHLINTDDTALSTAFLAACRDHVAGDGCVIIQQQAPGWFASAADAEYAVLRAVLDGAGLRLDRYLTENRGWLRAVPA